MLLYKLAKLGINGNMLNWLEIFLKDRTYQVTIEDQLSEKRTATRGVPQGSCLSPTLFNVMIYDIPKMAEVMSAELADDLAIAVTGNTIAEIIEKIKQMINKIVDWTKRWELTLNPSKTKAMMFTKKKIPDILPELKINDTQIEWVRSFKYLGLTLDAPTLTWKDHIREIQRDATQRLNVMRAIAGASWGADRVLLLNLYKSFIRSKITYGIAAVTSASNTYMVMLERIQNAALRITLEARKTSPVIAMQVEADLPPLKIYCQEICCRQYCKLKSQNDNHPIAKKIHNDPDVENKVWTKITKKTLSKRAEEIMNWWRIPTNIEMKIEAIPESPRGNKLTSILKQI